jgi:succinate-semialdehyde dehydrogenase / glutarate-semialdehyde dehydrogenase
MSRFVSRNPANGEILAEFEAGVPEHALSLAARAFPHRRSTDFSRRAALMDRLAHVLDSRLEHLARLATLEMGKTLASARDEVRKCAVCCRFYAAHAERFLASEAVDVSEAKVVVDFQPLGVILAVMPWNFPFWQVFRFAVPTLMAGNVAILKHASNVPQCALAIEDVFREAGFSEGVFTTLLIGSSEVAKLIADPRIAAVSLTGSVGAGREVASVAGRCLKKCVLELGGSDPFIVMPSADLELAVATAVKARIINNGQSCIAAKRFLVHSDLYDDFERAFVDHMNALRIGDPMQDGVELGPLATAQGLEDLERQVAACVESGAKVLTGGKRQEGRGYLYEPTVLTDLDADSPASREEIFGPVAMLFRVRDREHAVELANSTSFGLGSSVWTRDPAEQHFFRERIDAGMVYFNTMVASDPRAPFGGIKDSGYGRELGTFGIREFVNPKTVWIAEPKPPTHNSAE